MPILDKYQDNPELLAYKLIQIEKRQDALDAHLKATDADIAAINEEKSKAMRWGITTLGSIVIILAGVIVKFFTDRLS